MSSTFSITSNLMLIALIARMSHLIYKLLEGKYNEWKSRKKFIRGLFWVLHIFDILTDFNFLLNSENIPIYWKIWMGIFTLVPMFISFYLVDFDLRSGIEAVVGLYIIDEEANEMSDYHKTAVILLENAP